MDASHGTPFGFVTFNAWRLRETARVPPLLATLRACAKSLGAPSDALPDVIALQELEGESALEHLATELAPTHSIETLVLARTRDGRPRSVVAVAFARGRFVLARRTPLPLGRLWPDHPRAALAIRLRDRTRDVSLDVVSVHLSSRPGNAAQARTLATSLRTYGLWDAPCVLVAGDLNVTRASAGFHTLTAGPLRDALPRESAPTHLLGARLDHVLAGAGLTLVRALDPHVARAATGIAVLPRDLLPARGERPAFPAAPVSDHQPVGGIFTITE